MYTLVLGHFPTAAACPGRLLGFVVGRCRRDVLLLGQVFAAGGATVFACAFFLVLVLRTGASAFTGVAALRLNWIRCFELIVG